MITQKVKNNLLRSIEKTNFTEAEFLVNALAVMNGKDNKEEYFNADIANEEDDRDYDELVEVFYQYDEDDDELQIEFNCGSNYLEVTFSGTKIAYNFTSDKYENFNSGVEKHPLYGDVFSRIKYDRKLINQLIYLVNNIDK